MELIGKIIVLGQTESKGSKDFKIRQVVVQTDEQYPQSIPVQFVQDKCYVLDKYAIGDIVKIAINLRGAEWQGKYYVNLNGWNIIKLESTGLTTEQQMPDREPVYGSASNTSLVTNDEEEDDLPF